MEELGSSQSGCTREKVHKTENVGQTAWRPYAPTGAMRLYDDGEGNVRETSLLLGHSLGPQHRQSALSALTGYSAHILRRILSKRQAHLADRITWKNTEVIDFGHCRRTPNRLKIRNSSVLLITAEMSMPILNCSTKVDTKLAFNLLHQPVCLPC